MLRQFKRQITKSEKTWGLILVSGYRDLFPSPSSAVIVVDEVGRTYETKMHTQAARIDGLTDWYHNHPDVDIGDTVLISVDESGKVHISLENVPGLVDSEGDKEVVGPPPLVEQQIEIVPSLEKTLEDILEKNLDQLEQGLRIYRDDAGIPGRQYSTDVGIIDLLCLDKMDNFVVIEIKRQTGSDVTVGQIARYMGWVKTKLVGNAQGVRGIIIAKDIDDRLAYALEVFPIVSVRKYQIDLKFI